MDAGNRHISGSTVAVFIRYVDRVGSEGAVQELLRRAGEERPIDELVDVGNWSTYAQACSLFEAARDVTADDEVGLRIGEEMLRQHAGTEVAALLRSLGSPGELLRNVAATASKYSTVTSMEALTIGETTATLAAMTRSGFRSHRLFCDFTAGMVSQASVLFGMEPAVVIERECQTRGAARCTYEARWDPVTASGADPTRRVAHLESQLAGLTERFEAFQATAAELVGASDVETLLPRIARRAGLAVRAPAHILAVRLPGEEALRVHDEGVAPEDIDVLVGEIFGEPSPTSAGGRLVVDVASARHVYGRLAALYPQGSTFFAQEHRLLSAYAAQAAAALDTATALRDVSRRNDTARDLLRLSSELANVASRDEVAQRIAGAVSTVVDCDFASVHLWDPSSERLSLRASVGLAKEAVDRMASISLADVPSLREIMDDRKPFLLGPQQPDTFLRRLLDVAGTLAMTVVPIAAGEGFFGVIAAGVAIGPERLSSNEHVTERLQGLAAQAGAALENARLLDEVSHRALHDSLTGLPNRTLLRDRLDHALSRSRRSGRRTGVLFVDLDGFKQVNDRLGHAIGDGVIVAAGDRIRSSLRPGDTVARMGGDEFAMVVPEMASIAVCDLVATKVLAALRRPLCVHGHEIRLAGSIGAVAGAGHESYDELVNRADLAMYDAKRGGGDRHVVAIAADPDASTIRHSWSLAQRPSVEILHVP